jgi:uncharacterized protein (DUF4415 family)
MAKAAALTSADLAPAPTDKASVKKRKTRASSQRGRYPSDDLVPMQFRMDAEFARAFRVTAANNDMKLNELLRACYAAFSKTA